MKATTLEWQHAVLQPDAGIEAAALNIPCQQIENLVLEGVARFALIEGAGDG